MGGYGGGFFVTLKLNIKRGRQTQLSRGFQKTIQKQMKQSSQS